MESLPTQYTFNQKGAVVTVAFAAIWALLSMIIAIEMELQSAFALVIFGIMTIIAWVLITLYIKKSKPAFILGIVLLILGLTGLFASPGDPPWYTFTNPISIIKEFLFVIDSLAGIYFSFKSFREL